MISHFHLPAKQLSSLSTETNLEPIPLCIYLAFKLSENTCYFCQHEALVFQSQYSLCVIPSPLFIHSNWLIFLLETKVLASNYTVSIPYKVIKCCSKQLGQPFIYMYNAPALHQREFTCNKMSQLNNITTQCSVLYSKYSLSSHTFRNSLVRYYSQYSICFIYLSPKYNN